MYQGHHIVGEIVQFALKRFRIFSNYFDSQRVGAPITNECSSGMLPWKK